MIKSCILRKRQDLSLLPSTVALTATGDDQDGAVPMPGHLHTAPNARNTKRLRSRHEIRRQVASRGTGGSGSASNSITTGNDGDHCRQNNKRKSCSFCRNAGHKIGKCPRITRWGKAPVSAEDRNSLATNIQTPTHFQVDPLVPGYTKTIARGGVPKGISGLVLHNKLFVQDGPSVTACISCTMLVGGGQVHDKYSEWPFTPDDVATFIIKSNRKVVINLMKPSQGQDGWQAFGHQQHGLSQQSYDHSLVALSQQSAGLGLMGYGIPVPAEESSREPWV